MSRPASRRQATTSADVTKPSLPMKRRKYCPVRPPRRTPRLPSSSSRPTWSPAGHWARSLPKLPCSRPMSTMKLGVAAHGHDLLRMAHDALVAGEALPELVGLAAAARRLEAEEGRLEARPLLLDHAPHEAGREDALRHLRQHPVVAPAGPAPSGRGPSAAGRRAPLPRPCAWRPARRMVLKAIMASTPRRDCADPYNRPPSTT